ncbi:DUF746 domain-containing protein [Paraburkholderia kururiensis]|uniref:DUF746 domain-containing protein n=1 Tax=Paraburkholderia kururiensis TaxID=984307 RepID=UPI001F0B9CA0|nr:DUF746 domain-containing protein [Paraburkholderia kururiensis]
MYDVTNAAPARRFDATVGAITAREPVDDEQTEDVALTDYLTRAWLELVNPHSAPLPRCPHCDGLRVRADRPKKGKLPPFFCHGCRKVFNRMTGTPFARLQDHAKGAAMIPLLSRQMSMMQAGARLGRTQKAVLSWLLAFRRYLLELDPSGSWEARVRLGVRVAPRARCARCGFEGGFHAGGFDPQRRRRIRCPRCGRSRLLDVMQGEGQAFEAVVMHDAIDSAVRARRKVFPDTEAPPVARAASVGDAAPAVKPRARPRLEDVVLPARTVPAGPVERREDPVLSAFLLPHVEAALGADREPGPCPWCDSTRTQHHLQARPSGLPGFHCRDCLAYFTRASNTPFTSSLARLHARRLVPMLGWRDTAAAAARELGMDPTVLHRWLSAWRQWLLLLDPGGEMEARVRLGMHPEPLVLTCGKCGHTGPVLLLGPARRRGVDGEGVRRIKFRCRQCGRSGRASLPAAASGTAA